ncbi:ATP-binding protein [Asanoa ishikariensis]|uniref:NACHT domain-containing protein n=1 Tax=Asanoa ishikariensis TaxID=137265 RepID=A0A1H3M7P5_9ACTN|nr:NACHT domain-containing protein [Asanoa ishikariensis]GIF65968.1 ATP-binding protein [Asanoa ishikariensis]SDY72740.1 NACHT domain-containing protein [Asanoa ishikariensis]
MPIEKAVFNAVGPVAKMLWTKFFAQPQGAGLATKTPKLDSRLPFTKPKTSLDGADLDRLTTKLASRLDEMRKAEFPDLAEGDVAVAIERVGRALERVAPLDATKLFELDLRPERLAKLVMQVPRNAERRADMGSGGRFFDRILDLVCVHIVEFFTTRPEFERRAAVEQIRRSGTPASSSGPTSARAADYIAFERQYADSVVRRMNKVSFYGLRSGGYPDEMSRDHPLDSTYVPLRAAPTTPGGRAESALSAGASPLEEVLGDNRRLIITGSAGTGKTTAMQWLALSAVGHVDNSLSARLRGVMPFFLPIRTFTEAKAFPDPESFLLPIAPHSAGAMPHGWVHDCLRSGRAAVLVDGIDEIPKPRRQAAVKWVASLVEEFENARFVVTSRPAALESAWSSLPGFAGYELTPASPDDVQAMLRSWSQVADLDPWAREATDELTELAGSRPHLARLLGNPALCALAWRFAAHGSGSSVPADVMSLCDASVNLFVSRRDMARGLWATEDVWLNVREHRYLLASIAWWMTRNGLESAPVAAVIDQIAQELPRVYPQAGSSGPDQREAAERVLRFLLVRSGLVGRVADDRIGFSNDTIRDYLSAVGALGRGDASMLANDAPNGRWEQTTVMATALEPSLVDLLLSRAQDGGADRPDLLRLLGAALEMGGRAPAGAFEQTVARLVPPADTSEAGVLAACGPAVLPLLAALPDLSEAQSAAVIRTAALIGGPAALDLIRRHRSDDRPSVVAELVRGWPRFDPETYAREVLAEAALAAQSLRVDSEVLLPHLRFLTQLTRLRCTGDLDLGKLDRPSALDTVEIRDNSVLTSDDLRPHLDGLTTLILENCPALTDLSVLDGARLLRLCVRDCAVDLRTIPPGCTAELELELQASGSLADLPAALPLVRLAWPSTSAQVRDLGLVARYPSLRDLTTSGWPTLAEFAVLAALPDLQALEINGAVIDDFAPLAALTNLRRLRVSYYVAPSDPSPIGRLAHLGRLCLENRGIGPASFDEAAIGTKAKVTLR